MPENRPLLSDRQAPPATIAFIGGGNMAAALISGLAADGYPTERILVSDPETEKTAALAARFGIRALADNAAAVAGADVLVLAVKPQVMRALCQTLRAPVQDRRPLVISIAAGIREADLQAWLGGGLPLVRTMPNTPAMIQAGATVLYAGPGVDAAQRSRAESVMRAVGLVRWVEDEALMDAVTALSGSGPAYFFLVMEALEEAGQGLGLDPADARLLSLQTALGAARMAIESEDPPAVLCQRVTSPGGTTEAALEVFEKGDLKGLFRKALEAARARSLTLSDLLGGNGDGQ